MAERDLLGAAATARLAQLTAALRADGVRVGVGELLAAHRALASLPLTEGGDARLALRAVLCADRADLARFERAFALVFDQSPPVGGDPTPLHELGRVAKEVLPRAGFDVPGSEPGGDRQPVPAAYSQVELLATKDFAEYSETESILARELIARLARRVPLRRSRRLGPSRRRGAELDLRRTVRASLRRGGDPVERHWRAATTRPRPVVLVLDVSGSMAPYARMLLQYAHACVAARRRVEAFAFGTRLTRITAELKGLDHDRALRRASAAVADFGGGTRIGASLAELNRLHGRRLGRGAAVVILSDGWDRGQPEQLAVEIARLRRSAHRLVWLNPLAADPRFEPLARGMQAALPSVDSLLAGNSLQSIEQLAEVLEAR